MSHGDALGAASCYLSVGDAGAAAQTLVRGGQIEMAAALILSLPAGGGGDGALRCGARFASGRRFLSGVGSPRGGCECRATPRLVRGACGWCARATPPLRATLWLSKIPGKCLNGLSGGDGGRGRRRGGFGVVRSSPGTWKSPPRRRSQPSTPSSRDPGRASHTAGRCPGGGERGVKCAQDVTRKCVPSDVTSVLHLRPRGGLGGL